MDVLEKSPGITVGKDGSIIMKGKPAVTVLIDGKPTQLSGADLQAYLSGISASQIDVVELIENPALNTMHPVMRASSISKQNQTGNGASTALSTLASAREFIQRPATAST